MATIKPVSFNRLPEIDENDGKVILHDGSQLGRSTKELGEIIDDRLRTGLEDGKQYAMTTSGWKDVVIPEVDLTPYAYSAGLEADKQFVMTDNGWAEVDLSPYALSADVNSKAEEISAWANETFLTGVDLSDYALSADVDTKADEITTWVDEKLFDYALSADVDTKAEEISSWANETFLTGVDLSDYALSADVEAALETKAYAIARVGGGGPLFGENMKFKFAPEGGTNLNLQEYDSSIDAWTDIGVIVTKENKGPNKILKTDNRNILQWIDPDYYTKSETSAALDGKEDKIFVAEYDVTTYQELLDAYNAGKKIICNYYPAKESLPTYVIVLKFNEYSPIQGLFKFSVQTANNAFKYVQCTFNDGDTSNTTWHEETTSIDLNNYYTKSETNDALNLKEDKVFVAEYNVTPYADIKAAYDAGKQIFLLAQNFNEYAPEGWSPYTFKVPLTDVYSLGNDTWFKFSFFNDSAIAKKITVVIKNNNVWSVGYNTLQDELFAGTGIVFREGTGADEGKTFVEVDSTNYKLLTTEEYNSLTAVIDTVSSYSASWVLTDN